MSQKCKRAPNRIRESGNAREAHGPRELHANSGASERKIRQAMDCLLRGDPAKTDGDLTLVNVAVEAGVGRATVYRAEALLEYWRRRLEELGAAQEAKHPVARLKQLKAEMVRAARDHAARVRALQDENDRLAQQVQALKLLLDRERDTKARDLSGSRTGGARPPEALRLLGSRTARRPAR